MGVELTSNAIQMKFSYLETTFVGEEPSSLVMKEESYEATSAKENQWYWVAGSRILTTAGFLTKAVLFDPVDFSFPIDSEAFWPWQAASSEQSEESSEESEQIYYNTSYSNQGYLITASGYRGSYQGLCGTLRTGVVQTATGWNDLTSALFFIGQRQNTEDIENSLFYYPFDSYTGQYLVNRLNQTHMGVFGTTEYPDAHDPYLDDSKVILFFFWMLVVLGSISNFFFCWGLYPRRSCYVIFNHLYFFHLSFNVFYLLDFPFLSLHNSNKLTYIYLA